MGAKEWWGDEGREAVWRHGEEREPELRRDGVWGSSEKEGSLVEMLLRNLLWVSSLIAKEGH